MKDKLDAAFVIGIDDPLDQPMDDADRLMRVEHIPEFAELGQHGGGIVIEDRRKGVAATDRGRDGTLVPSIASTNRAEEQPTHTCPDIAAASPYLWQA